MEVCVDNIESALNAVAGGACRIELCSALSEGGLTPSLGFFKTVRRLVALPIFVMLRPRCGIDFVYTDQELESMMYDAVEFKNAGANGFVFGILYADGTVNAAACSEILKIINPSPATFHRAFDYVTDPIESLNKIIDLGFKRILTSGQKRTAFEGLELLKELINAANKRIIIVPGAGVNEKNAYDILKYSGATEIHGSAKRAVSLRPKGASNAALLSSAETENQLHITDVETVRKIVAIVNEVECKRER